jgi:hypothetical protein
MLQKMKKFLKPSRWSIILFIAVFLTVAFFWYTTFQLSVNHPSLCIPGLSSPLPLSFLNILKQIPAVLAKSYDHCTYSKSLAAAITTVFYGMFIVLGIVSYMISCVLVSLLKTRKGRITMIIAILVILFFPLPISQACIAIISNSYISCVPPWETIGNLIYSTYIFPLLNPNSWLFIPL